MIENEPLDPVDVSLLGADTVMFAAENVPHLIEEFWFARVRHSPYPLCHASDFVLSAPELKPD